MRSIRMAALAVAITFMFSGLALARDHDHDKYHHDKHDKHDLTSVTTATGMIAITGAIKITGAMEIATATANAGNMIAATLTIIGGSAIITATMATITRERFITTLPRVIPASLSISAMSHFDIRMAHTPTEATPIQAEEDMTIPARGIAAPATAAKWPTISAIRMAATWRAGIGKETSASIRIPATSTETGRTAMIAPWATRITIVPSTPTDI
jgi:hypothetical protein